MSNQDVAQESKVQKRLSTPETKALLESFLRLMSDRADTYRTFDEGFRIFKRDRLFPAYQALCGVVTKRFQEISASVISIETALRDGGAEQWAAAIRQVQNLEREKLHMVRFRGLFFADSRLLIAFLTFPLPLGTQTAHSHMLHTRHTILADEFYSDEFTTASLDFRASLARAVEGINEQVDEIRDWIEDH